jgi:hypothetical protein
LFDVLYEDFFLHYNVRIKEFKDKKKIEQEKMRERENYYLKRRSFK